MNRSVGRGAGAVLIVMTALAAAAVAQDGAPPLSRLVMNWQSADWGPPTNRPGFPADFHFVEP